MANSLTPRLNEIESKLPNIIINGNFDIWQRQITGSLGYVADKWRTSHAGIGSANVSQDRDSDVPYGYGYSAKITCDTTYSQAAASVFGYMNAIEGYFLRDYVGKEVTVSFHVKANHTATYSINLLGNGSQTYVHPFTINTANTWQKVEFTTTIPNDVNWEVQAGSSLTVIFELLSDPNRHTSTTDTWIVDAANNTRGFNGQDNLFDTIGNEIQFSKVMITADPAPDNTYVYAGRNWSEEFDLCERYYQKSYSLGIFPGTSITWAQGAGARWTTSAAAYAQHVHFNKRMRTSPTVSVYDWAGNLNRVRSGGSDNQTDYTILGASESRFFINANNTEAEMLFAWIADADF